jgi:hypothetical protein
MAPPERPLRLSTVVAIVLGIASPLAAQNSNIAPSPSSSAPDTTSVASGWVLTPSIAASTGWDNNVFVQGQGDEGTGDLINTINPRLATTYNGRRSLLSINYSGAFLLYRDLSELNSFDQRASLSGRRRLTKQLTFYVDNAFAKTPTTEISGLVAVPFVRTGSTLDDLRAGLEAALSKRTTLSVGGDFQWVAFDENPLFVTQLHGGHGFGGEASLRHKLSARTSLLADYRMQHAMISQSIESFDVWTTGGGVEQQFSEHLTAFGELGISHLVATVLSESRTGPAIRAGLTYRAPKSSVIVSYSRMFVPSYGFGGTTQNEELSASLNVPLSRRLYTQGGTAWRRNEPLTIGNPSLRSYWLEGALGYDFNGVAQIEGFFGTAHQVIDRPGGIVNRSRIGVQVVTAKRVRIH